MAETRMPSCREIAASVRDGSRRAQDIVTDSLARIAAHDGGLGAFVGVFTDRAMAKAEAIDAARARGAELPPLAGVPFATKDNILVQGEIAACGSRIRSALHRDRGRAARSARSDRSRTHEHG